MGNYVAGIDNTYGLPHQLVGRATYAAYAPGAQMGSGKNAEIFHGLPPVTGRMPLSEQMALGLTPDTSFHTLSRTTLGTANWNGTASAAGGPAERAQRNAQLRSQLMERRRQMWQVTGTGQTGELPGMPGSGGLT